jgi:outer membrane receptor for ferrienterochelin and colicins
MRLILFIFTFSFFSVSLLAQGGSIEGTIKDVKGEPIPFSNLYFPQLSIGTSSDEKGKFSLENIPEGKYLLQISAVGYVNNTDSIVIEKGQTNKLDLQLKQDILKLSQVVVTGSRNQVEQYNSPVIVNTINAKTFETTQSINVADGLNFSPGLRVENNCQNCGFTQLRMNGLDGPYSQVLINSRPVFSALARVYGLEMLPANMVDRIEVVRGGGSVMYGGNAIAGTVNIITKDPFENSFELGLNQSFINAESPDRTVNFNGSIVSDDLNKGVTLFGFNRERDHWDANGDDFSEIVELQNNTLGFDAFVNVDDRNRIKLGAYYISEYRRGGNEFDLAPHQTDIT